MDGLMVWLIGSRCKVSTASTFSSVTISAEAIVSIIPSVIARRFRHSIPAKFPEIVWSSIRRAKIAVFCWMIKIGPEFVSTV